MKWEKDSPPFSERLDTTRGRTPKSIPTGAAAPPTTLLCSTESKRGPLECVPTVKRLLLLCCPALLLCAVT